ncbi:MAG: RibD family protein [Desulfomonilaceae bacterium]|nr:RibD family protein [Desulfomonilaceae bacterium]
MTLSYAQSLDGSISARPGESLALSGEESLKLTHRLRAEHDAILVGIGTVLSDDPRLNVRLVSGENPRPVVVDSRLRLPLGSRLMTQESMRPWIFTRQEPDVNRREALEEAGATVITVPSNARGQVNLQAMLGKLADMGISSLMVEGGSRIITNFLYERLANYIVLTVAPVFVGGLHAVSDLGQSDPTCFLRLQDPSHTWIGGDLVVWGALAQGADGNHSESR